MSIERDKEIVFHEEGTLDAVTRWISSHDEGIAEWLKNARRAYQPDRGNVADADRVAVILLKDAGKHGAARIDFATPAISGASLQALRPRRLDNV
jgi:hypothetical protein